ncbi:NADH-quinone oxidoreductase subunit I|uniref:NADH-quinone oxidoreductase subunit I n=1 Tax=Dendrosporobacter quercicolus TaxID=146817 RepID=A0A1G9W3Y9_9FIRM|nr:NADH-quinone oxidoreductase subunit I [Dendrosporobacter quercicolus]NSL47725.1 NADH-quinone oxidoreductase subunit I [Dendrosporobacter quercicolus DSM 1736]SDM79254.1 NADH-quinone oxidoreductase subunit I [Dendrosporobacter quercicolus]
MLGKGLLKGMRITLRSFFCKKVTLQYPDEKLAMPARFRGGELELDHQKCIACGLCAMACPNRVIKLTTGANEQKKRCLTSYVYQSGLCLYCNYCIEACPTKAICWDKNYENARYFRKELDVDCLALSLERTAAGAAEEAAFTGKTATAEVEGAPGGRSAE